LAGTAFAGGQRTNQAPTALRNEHTIAREKNGWAHRGVDRE